MSHLVDIDGMLEKLVLLQHFSDGSRSYCADRLAGSEEDPGDGELDEYWGWVKGIVSTYTLECSIKFRVLQDSTNGEVERQRFIDLDAKSRLGLDLGNVTSGNFDLTLRECCNKIIHATHVMPAWECGMHGDVEFKFWNGTVQLSGNRDDKLWALTLNVAAWAHAMQRFLADSDSVEAFRYVGQDWFPKKHAP